jgi:3-hydroxy-3-methylglutaryl CoA synthase
MSKYALASLLIHHLRGTNKFRKVEEEIGKEPKLLDIGSLESMRKDKSYINKYFSYNKKFRSTQLFKNFYNKKVKPSITANSIVGNVYNGSLYLSLGSLIEHGEIKNNSIIGFGAYGSGSSSQFFSGNLIKRKNLSLNEQLVYRKKLEIEEYEKIRISN